MVKRCLVKRRFWKHLILFIPTWGKSSKQQWLWLARIPWVGETCMPQRSPCARPLYLWHQPVDTDLEMGLKQEGKDFLHSTQPTLKITSTWYRFPLLCWKPVNLLPLCREVGGNPGWGPTPSSMGLSNPWSKPGIIDAGEQLQMKGMSVCAGGEALLK